jgi:hypothetical protein
MPSEESANSVWKPVTRIKLHGLGMEAVIGVLEPKITGSIAQFLLDSPKERDSGSRNGRARLTLRRAKD